LKSFAATYTSEFKCTPGSFQTAIYCTIINKVYM